MKNIFVLLSVLLSFSAYAQENSKQNMKVEMTRDAYYPEGDKAFYTFVFHNLKYTDEARANKVAGDVMISFFVEADSSLTGIKVLTDLGFGCTENMKELLKNVKFIPALINGIPMRSKVLLTVPIRAH
jgi:protein TonB